MTNKQQRPLVGIAVMVLKEGKVLLSRRSSSVGTGEYAFPGGHLEHMESFEDCARREVKEESGISIRNIQFLLLSNVKDYAPKHYVLVGLVADWADGEPQVLEPTKNESWGWYDMDNLPQPLFATIVDQVHAYKTGECYLDK